MAFATAAMAVAGFVAVSVLLKSLAHLALGSLRLVEDSFGQSAEYVLVSALSMFVVRKSMNILGVKSQGSIIVFAFLAISVLAMTFALSSGAMQVDFLVSLMQMSALCLIAYLQFWGSDRRPW